MALPLAGAACVADAGPAAHHEREAVEEAAEAWDLSSVTNDAKSTHLWIVNRAFDILAKHKDIAAERHALANALYLDSIAHSDCRQWWQQGIYDADMLDQYNDGGTSSPLSGWKSHFYDPATGTNYKGETSPTAMTEQRRHLQKFRDLNSQDAQAAACYELGLALHYMTDVTQPMHAANFTALDLPFEFHSHFEPYIMSIQSAWARADWSGYPTLTTKDALVTGAAVTAKGLFDPIYDQGTACQTSWDGNVSYFDTRCWEGGPIDLLGGAALFEAQDYTAKYLWRVLLDVRRPVQISAWQESPSAIAADQTNAYWIMAGSAIMTRPITGGPALKLASLQGQASDLALDGARVYWVNRTAGTVMSVAKSGGAPSVLATGQSSPAKLAVGASEVFWTNGDGTVMRASKSGGAPSVLASGQTGLRGVATFGNNVYWTKYDSAENLGSVVKQPLSGGGSTVLHAASGAAPDALAADASNVYWTDPNAAKVSKVAIGGGVAKVIAVGQSQLAGITAANGAVYWTSTGLGAVTKTSANGGPIIPLATQQPSPVGVAVAGDGIVWVLADPGDGTGKINVMADPDSYLFP